MVRVCAAVECRNKDNRGSRKRGITFHRFPADTKKCKKWVDAMCLSGDDWRPQYWHRLCSAHFHEDLLIRKGRFTVLVPGAVPSIFELDPDEYMNKQVGIFRPGENEGDEKTFLAANNATGHIDHMMKHNINPQVYHDHNYCFFRPSDFVNEVRLDTTSRRHSEMVPGCGRGCSDELTPNPVWICRQLDHSYCRSSSVCESSTVTKERHQNNTVQDLSHSTIRCICNFPHDDSHMVRCLKCCVLQHAECMGVTSEDVAGQYHCELCQPRPVDKQRAITLQTIKVTSAFRTLKENGSLDTSKKMSATATVGGDANATTQWTNSRTDYSPEDGTSLHDTTADEGLQRGRPDVGLQRGTPDVGLQDTSKITQQRPLVRRKIFRCPICQRDFGKNSHLVRHGLTHTQGTRCFQCRTCRKKFKSAEALDKHELKPYGHWFPCLECDQTFVKKKLLLRHIVSHVYGHATEDIKSSTECDGNSSILHNENTQSGELPTSHSKPQLLIPSAKDVEICLKCSYCKSVFTSRQDLCKHILSHLVNKPFKCRQCEGKFKSRQSLDRHIKLMHTLHKKPFVCSECGKRFQTIKSLNMHIIQQCKDGQLTCPKCEAKFDNIDQLNLHLETHKVSCQYCHVIVNSSELLEIHTRIHTGERPFSCPDCGETFISQLEADKHKDRCELLDMDKLSYTCEGCDEKFASKRRFTRHRCFRHKIQALFSCDKCVRAFKTQENLDKHQQVHASETRYACADCDFTTTRPYSLRTHRDIHTKAYTCSYCDKTFHKQISLFNHLRIHTGEKPFPCPGCGVRFRTEKSLRCHEKTHLRLRRYQCIKCDRKYSSRGNMRRHLLTHYGIKQKIYKPTGVRSSTDLLCDVCGERFTEKRFLTTHKNKHSCQRTYECQTCKKRFLSRSALYNHKFVHNSEKTLECVICKARFKNKSSFYIHKYTHQKRYYCDKCDVWFGIKLNWKCHMYKHTGEKPYQCTTCKASFRTPTGLSAHRKTHDKPYRCKQCDARFGSQEGLANHMYQHTDEKPTCSQCQKTFSGIRNLRIHLKKIHGIIVPRLPRGPHRKDTTCIKTEPNENIPSHEVYTATSTTVDFKKESFASSQQVVVDIQEETRNASDVLIAATTVAIDTTASTNQQLTLQEHEQILHNLTEITPGQTEQISLDSNLTKIELEDLQQISTDSETIVLYMK